jgi:dienelactone hydrolase
MVAAYRCRRTSKALLSAPGATSFDGVPDAAGQSVEMFGAATALSYDGPEPRRVPLPVQRSGAAVPASLWLPVSGAGPWPAVLVGHGAGGHKEAPIVVRAARELTALGCAVVSIDLPFHGDRTPPEEVGLSAAERRSRLGLDGWRARNALATTEAVADWRAALDAAQARPEVTGGPAGYFGLSLGTRSGLPLTAAEERISVAALGLFGYSAQTGPPGVAEAARGVTIPVLFLVQWDDELYPRSDGLALFDLLASPRKTLHANPGRHLDIPATEISAALRFVAGQLPGGLGARRPGRLVTDVLPEPG